jgi:enamine deaminase RidA (YjgF/YER057c/UK114 family)
MQRDRYSTGTPWESLVGYSRAVRVGPHVHVSGTTATDADGNLVGVGDPAAQAEQVLQNIDAALKALGAELSDVVRTRVYVTDISHWEAVGRVHGKWFADVRPASALLAVSGLVNPDMLVEMEADAIVG